MDQSYLLVRGGKKLTGELCVQGSKNTVLPVLAACLLARGKTTLFHCPRITDVSMMTAVLESVGCRILWEEDRLTIDTSRAYGGDLPFLYTGNFRASVLFLGAMLGRWGYVSMGKPGGCRIGKRPIDFHLNGFRSLGAQIVETKDRYYCYGSHLKGTTIRLPFPSVGATENILLAAVLSEGVTVIEGCAKEPEIEDLARYLSGMGAKISGIGTNRMVVTGKSRLHSADYIVPADRIVTATYLLGAMVTGGNITLVTGGTKSRFESIFAVLEKMGARIFWNRDRIELFMNGKIRPVCLATGPHPDPPTDIQSMVLACVLTASGPSWIEENIFESRYQVADELRKMGGDITICGQHAMVRPVGHLTGCQVEAADLRGGAALVLAGLSAQGETAISSLSYLKRGYENIAQDFRQLGADITEMVR